VIPVKAYILVDSDKKESILVIRTEDIEIIRTIVNKISRIRNKTIRELARLLQEDLND